MGTSPSHSPGRAAVELLRDAFAALNRKDLDAGTEMLTEDFVINIAGMPFQMHGRDAWRQNVSVMRAAFPDFRVRIEDIFGSGDRVAVLLTMRGTHQGEFRGIPATGRRVEYTSAELYRVADGRIAEEWIYSDTETLMRQLDGAGAPDA
ncbi:ester cyclase [Streptomyces sp. WAC 06738]|uniref:ester cyclase n=1 Tax=Streptomyces sp. WAC 06738 TaxID=2203210 RepID=UPI000F6CCBAF|nr:ester cyclase [Streptomyces sp. WAC 06738]AZM49731.1 ester cyclase [Streptomyces sp. WAC 06738]